MALHIAKSNANHTQDKADITDEIQGQALMIGDILILGFKSLNVVQFLSLLIDERSDQLGN